jgi:hypothetical protein
MHFFKSTLFAFLIAFTVHPKALESISQDRLPGDKVATSTEDIAAVKGLIKKEFAIQGKLLGNETAALSKLVVQINNLEASLKKALDAINLNQFSELYHLHLIDGLLSSLLIAQILSICKIRKYRDNIIQDIASKIEAANSNTKSGLAVPDLDSLLDAPSGFGKPTPIAPEALPSTTLINSDALIANSFSFLKIEIEKASRILASPDGQATEVMPNQNGLEKEMLTLSFEVEKIKIWGLERAQQQRPEPRQLPPKTRRLIKSLRLTPSNFLAQTN